VIHHELAEFPSTERLRDALDTSVATSVGLSLSELTVLAGLRGDPRLLAREAAERAGAQRLIVHADTWALAVHRDDPAHQTGVLLAGNALAASRARAGRPTDALVPGEDAAYADDLPQSGRLGDGWFATSVPSPYLPRPAATIGLGDTFVAGVLLAESLI
jgi:ADP-dependent phosphofructokinase/glucokinase